MSLSKNRNQALLLKKLTLKNFRNLNLECAVDPKLNLIIGDNGIGKSNFLDSIYYLAYCKSFKPYSERNNVAFNSEFNFSVVEAKAVTKENNLDLKIIFTRAGESETRRFLINDSGKVRAKFQGNVHAIIFAPHNINLIAGTPDVRRDELDDFISGVDVNYGLNLAVYKKVVRNRNKVLATISDTGDGYGQLDYWNVQLLNLGCLILEKRLEIIKKFQPVLTAQSQTIFKDEISDLTINYISKLLDGGDDFRAYFEQKLKDNQAKEIAAHQTLYGPHKDDFLLNAGGKDLKIFGSRGQQRIATLILKIAMWHYMSTVVGEKPILLLDDIMSELDPTNMKKLEDIVTSLDTQTFISGTHAEHFTNTIKEKSKLISLL